MNKALLVMDYQTDIVAMLGDKGPPVVERAGQLVAAARAANVPIIYVVVGFRPGYPEASPRNKNLAVVMKTGRFQGTTPGADIVEGLKPADGDVIVVKHRAGSFASSDLDMVLRVRDIHSLILLGLSTSGVVLSTVRHAADHDYEITVARDGCADGDDEVHRVLMDKVFVRQANVATCAEIIAGLAA
ncbi:MAG TPA: isochorismatase family cysteine hydrolase [Kofleriaceae bacterium]